MYEFNSNFNKFPGGYLFAVLHQKLDAYKREHPEAKVISLGVGDVTLPLPMLHQLYSSLSWNWNLFQPADLPYPHKPHVPVMQGSDLPPCYLSVPGLSVL